jgi:hypothetical protein
MATTVADLAPSTYTPGELAYLLAGRDNPEAVRARSILGLAELGEGDDRILPAVQSLASKGQVDTNGEDVQLSLSAQTIGFVLGTATDWTRVVVNADGNIDVLIVVSAPEVLGGLVLRADRLGNYLAVATKPGVHPSQISGSVVAGYLANSKAITVSIHRDTSSSKRALAADRTEAGAWTLTKRVGLGGDDIASPSTAETDEAAFLADLETLLADEQA